MHLSITFYTYLPCSSTCCHTLMDYIDHWCRADRRDRNPGHYSRIGCSLPCHNPACYSHVHRIRLCQNHPCYNLKFKIPLTVTFLRGTLLNYHRTCGALRKMSENKYT